jgi:hypothetical protein
MMSRLRGCGHKEAGRWRGDPVVAVAFALVLLALPLGLVRTFTTGPEVITAVRGAVTCALVAAAGMLMSVVAFVRRGSRPTAGGAGWTMAGMAAVSALVCGTALVMAPTGARRLQSQERRLSCAYNMKSLSQAVRMYAQDYGETFPPARGWCENLMPYVAEARPLRYPLVCPEATELACGYAYNAILTGLSLDSLADPARVVMFSESDVGWDAAGGPALLPAQPRHDGADNYAMADGRALPAARALAGRDKGGAKRWQQAPDRAWIGWDPFAPGKTDSGRGAGPLPSAATPPGRRK